MNLIWVIPTKESEPEAYLRVSFLFWSIWMLIRLNGAIEEVPENATVRDVMTGKKLPEEMAVVALNDEVIRRDNWPSVRLKADDRMEVIRIIGGG